MKLTQTTRLVHCRPVSYSLSLRERVRVRGFKNAFSRQDTRNAKNSKQHYCRSGESRERLCRCRNPSRLSPLLPFYRAIAVPKRFSWRSWRLGERTKPGGRGRFKRIVATLTALALACQPVLAQWPWVFLVAPAAVYADAITDAGAEGHAFGQSLLKAPANDDGKIYWQKQDGSGPVESMDAADLFPGMGAADYSADMDTNFGDDNAAQAFGASTLLNLENEDSVYADAYRGIKKATEENEHPDYINEPFLDRSKEVMDGDDPIFDTVFGGCVEVPQGTTGGNSVHIPDYKTCEKLKDDSGSCLAEHPYTVELLRHKDGPFNLQSCGPGCLNLWIGQVGNNYWSGYCSIFEQTTTIEMIAPGAVTSATLEYAKWDDYMQVYLNEDKVWNGPNDNFPPETAGACELSTSWETNPGVDITPWFQNAGDLTFKIRVSVTDKGEGYARIRILYDPKKTIVGDAWDISAECQQRITGLQDGVCTGTMTCTDMPFLDADGCAELYDVKYCESDFVPSPIAGISPLCRQVQVDADCSGYYTGDLECYIDVNGEEQCPVNEGGNLDTCTQYAADPQCAFVSSSCVGNSTGASGACYIVEQVWDCGTNVSIPGTQQSTTLCAGAVRCMGEECVSHPKENNPDFARAASAAQAMNFMAMNMDCSVDINGNSGCTVFGGDGYECKKALGGWQNCCETPTGISLADYFAMGMATWKVANQTGLITKLADLGMNIPGAWNAVTNTASATWSTITKPITSAWGSLVQSTTGATAEAVSSFSIEQLKQQVTNKIGEFVTETFGEEVAASFFTEQGGEYVVNETLVNAANFLGTAFMIYAIANILVQIIYKCEPEEFELGAKRELKSCTYIGNYCNQEHPILGCIEKRESYCCYDSPLARIVQDSVHDQLAQPWGTPEAPQCGGLNLADLDQIDWNQVDLDEWYGILVEGGVIPQDAAEFDTQYSMDSATTNPYAGVPTPNSLERANDRMQEMDNDIDATRSKVRSDLYSQ